MVLVSLGCLWLVCARFPVLLLILFRVGFWVWCFVFGFCFMIVNFLDLVVLGILGFCELLIVLFWLFGIDVGLWFV